MTEQIYRSTGKCYCCQDPVDLGKYHYYAALYKINHEEIMRERLPDISLCGVHYQMLMLYLEGVRERLLPEAQDAN